MSSSTPVQFSFIDAATRTLISLPFFNISCVNFKTNSSSHSPAFARKRGGERKRWRVREGRTVAAVVVVAVAAEVMVAVEGGGGRKTRSK